MLANTVVNNIEQAVNKLLADEPEYFLVDVRIKPSSNVKVYLDGDNGITIEKCIQINRQLYKQIEESSIFPSGDFSLEVSSPGVDNPLKSKRQYQKNIGRVIQVMLNDEAGKTGKLLQVSDNDILIEETTGKGKKTEIKQTVIPLTNIKTTTVQIEF